MVKQFQFRPLTELNYPILLCENVNWFNPNSITMLSIVVVNSGLVRPIWLNNFSSDLPLKKKKKNFSSDHWPNWSTHVISSRISFHFSRFPPVSHFSPFWLNFSLKKKTNDLFLQFFFIKYIQSKCMQSTNIMSWDLRMHV